GGADRVQSGRPAHPSDVARRPGGACPMLSVVTLGSWPLWVGFLAFVGVMLALDLGVFHRKAHLVSLREAAVWSGVWISLAAVFALGVFQFFGPQRGLE